MIVNSDINKHAVKTINNSSEHDDELDKLIIKGSVSKGKIAGDELPYEYKYEALEKEYLIASDLAKNEDLKDFLIGVCDSKVNKYPGAVIVMEYGGKTLSDYFKGVARNIVAPISQGARVKFYERMFDLLKALEKHDYTFCDLNQQT